ncbi:hypothetical protein [Yersinia phage MHG19]|nr:hypothetical protein [Yersinia phage MHG19]
MKKLILLAALVLVGCANDPVKQPTKHLDPSWPTPVQSYSTEWKVIIVDGQAYMALPYGESQEFRIWLEDVKRYVKDQKGMICYYRKDLREEKCDQMP